MYKKNNILINRTFYAKVPENYPIKKSSHSSKMPKWEDANY